MRAGFVGQVGVGEGRFVRLSDRVMASGYQERDRVVEILEIV